jgi:hypothetical protein
VRKLGLVYRVALVRKLGLRGPNTAPVVSTLFSLNFNLIVLCNIATFCNHRATTSLPHYLTAPLYTFHSFTTMLLYRTINTHLCPRVGNACVSVSVRARACFSSQNIDEVRAEFTRQSGNFENEWTTCMYSLQAQHG